MKHVTKFAAIACLGLVLTVANQARAASEQQNLVEESRITLDHRKAIRNSAMRAICCSAPAPC